MLLQAELHSQAQVPLPSRLLPRTYLSRSSSGKGRVREKGCLCTSRPRFHMVFSSQATGIPLKAEESA